MKPAPFDYVKPATVADASAALRMNGGNTAAIAGGQSLLPMLSLRVAQPDLLVDLSGLDELKETSATQDTVRIGALTTHAAIEDGKLAEKFGGMMQKVAARISYRAVRNHGTIGGSVALADPAADWPGCLMVLGAKVRISGGNGARSEPIGDFVQGPYATTLGPGDIILGFDIPRPDPRMRWGACKVVRKSGAFASSIAFAVEHSPGGPVSVVLAAATVRPCKLPMVADHVRAGKRSEDELRAAIAADMAEHAPQDDPYLVRLHASTVLRAIREMQSR
jgi:carbon-monoxide dehydrogenase medium subunit